jgi:transitional endoplasmic reticulum ATPase
VARTLDRPLLVRRASDLLSKWLGESEQHIAAMFREAEQEQAVLLLDEADSFLRERAGAHHAWEVTQVNELLTQMEDFEGVFIAATNLIETLDAAALRRFDLKVRFDYLAPAQAFRLFEQVLTEQGSIQPLDDLTRERLSRLDRLTPGDFAAVIRRFEITAASWTPEALLAALRAEHQGKPGGARRPIGFATSA